MRDVPDDLPYLKLAAGREVEVRGHVAAQHAVEPPRTDVPPDAPPPPVADEQD